MGVGKGQGSRARVRQSSTRRGVSAVSPLVVGDQTFEGFGAKRALRAWLGLGLRLGSGVRVRDWPVLLYPQRCGAVRLCLAQGGQRPWD